MSSNAQDTSYVQQSSYVPLSTSRLPILGLLAQNSYNTLPSQYPTSCAPDGLSTILMLDILPGTFPPLLRMRLGFCLWCPIAQNNSTPLLPCRIFANGDTT